MKNLNCNLLAYKFTNYCFLMFKIKIGDYYDFEIHQNLMMFACFVRFLIFKVQLLRCNLRWIFNIFCSEYINFKWKTTYLQSKLKLRLIIDISSEFKLCKIYKQILKDKEKQKNPKKQKTNKQTKKLKHLKIYKRLKKIQKDSNRF